MQYHNKECSDVVSYFSSDSVYGINEKEIDNRRKKYGLNELGNKKKKSLVKKFLSQFENAMIIILIISAVISFFIALEGDDNKEYIEPIVILFIVFLNATLGTIQENKAEKTLEELNKLSSFHSVVIRDGKEKKIESSLLVPGDIVLLEAGDVVPADCRIIEEVSLKVDESFLTGESVAVEKDNKTIYKEVHSVGDLTNMVFSGSSILMGKCKAIVCDIGMNTKIGSIARTINDENESKAPIEKKLEVLSKFIGLCALGLCIIIFFIGLLSGIKVLDMFMISISLAVAAIPEGLPALVTIVFALGVQKMVKRNAIIRKLPAVETLGSASVICTDKTGTLTMNKLSLVELCINNRKNIDLLLNDNEIDLLRYASFCTSLKDVDGVLNGDPLDEELNNQFLNRFGKEQYKIIGELPFDSNRKLMSVVVEYHDKKYVVTKGAFESVFKISTYVNDSFKHNNNEMSKDGLRVIAVAIKEIDDVVILSSDYIERDLKFLGLLGFKDLPREGVDISVSMCKEAGIKPVMITGDYVVTAVSIAKSLGIYSEGDMSISGEILHSMSDDDLYNVIDKVSVYARVNPEDKIRIVKTWQNKGHVVAMTGDGVNDAPALKAADIGCAMGKNGTEVAKNAADLVLVDDDFSTIVDSVKEGRNIYDNVKKSIIFLLGTNMGEIFTMLFAMIFWQISPLVSMQLLWVNLVTDIAPALALGMEKPEEDIMKKKPKKKDEKLLSLDELLKIIIQGIFFSFLVLFGFVRGSNVSVDYARTMAFIIISLSQLFHAFNKRSEKSLLEIGIFSNKYLVYGTVISLFFMGIVCFIEPIVEIFSLEILKPIDYIICIILSIVPVFVSEIIKKIKRSI